EQGIHMLDSEYKNRFASQEAVSEYLQVYADEKSYANVLYEIEKQALSKMIDGINGGKMKGRYLDFAVGTGRIITHLEGLFESSEGVDISAEMIAVSRSRVKRSTLRQADVTKESPPVEPY